MIAMLAMPAAHLICMLILTVIVAIERFFDRPRQVCEWVAVALASGAAIATSMM
jgi:hypothetical protein